MTAAKLIELEAKATEGTWYVDECKQPDGHALAWLGNVYLDTDAPKVNGTRYKEPKDDADFIVELRNHAQDFIKLIEAAEQEHGGSHHEPECPICVAVAAFKEE